MGISIDMSVGNIQKFKFNFALCYWDQVYLIDVAYNNDISYYATNN